MVYPSGWGFQPCASQYGRLKSPVDNIRVGRGREARGGVQKKRDSSNLVLSKPSGAETQKTRTVKGAQSPSLETRLSGEPGFEAKSLPKARDLFTEVRGERKSASSSVESRAEDKQVAEPTHLADKTGNLADEPIPEFPNDEKTLQVS